MAKLSLVLVAQNQAGDLKTKHFDTYDQLHAWLLDINETKAISEVDKADQLIQLLHASLEKVLLGDDPEIVFEHLGAMKKTIEILNHQIEIFKYLTAD